MSGVFFNLKLREILIKKYHQLSTVGDLCRLINWVKKITNPEYREINPDDLWFLVEKKDFLYYEFMIKKKSGGQRQIKSPSDLLMHVQTQLNFILQTIFEPNAHYCSNGFLYGRDIIRNAKPHVNKKFILNCDVENFFPSINFRRVKVVLELSPFLLKNNRELIGYLIANLCTQKNSLPQGSPTSPLLSNIVTQRLDRKINKLCLFNNVKYTRYADDLSFSCNKNLFDDNFLFDIRKILREENFNLNEQKTRIKTDMDRQQVTGLVVNEKLNVKREYLQMVRAMLNNWDKGGLEYAKLRFKETIKGEKRREFQNVLSGHISFIGNVRGKEDYQFRKLYIKLNTLKNRIDYSFIDSLSARKRLISDNLKMEKIVLDKIHSDDQRFISFCTAAFHQIENLLNYFYYRRYPNLNHLLEFLLNENEVFKKSYNNLEKSAKKVKKIGDLSIHVLIYVFEKEFFINPKKDFYDRRITKLREIRNDDSHRCSVLDFDNFNVTKQYNDLQALKDEHFTVNKKYMELSTEEIKLEFKHSLLEFLKDEDYYFVRKIVKEVAEIVKVNLNHTPLSRELHATSLNPVIN